MSVIEKGRMKAVVNSLARAELLKAARKTGSPRRILTMTMRRTQELVQLDLLTFPRCFTLWFECVPPCYLTPYCLQRARLHAGRPMA